MKVLSFRQKKPMTLELLHAALKVALKERRGPLIISARELNRLMAWNTEMVEIAFTKDGSIIFECTKRQEAR